MKKKFLLIGATTALAGFAALSLGSCGSDDNSGPQAENGTLDILLNYSGTGGISRAAGQGSTNDAITGAQITEGTLLPTWKAFASYTKTALRDASTYAQTSDNNVWDAVASGDEIKSQTNSSEYVDLLYNSTANFNNNVSKLQSLNSYLGLDAEGNAVAGAEVLMPNFRKWLDENPTMAKAIKRSGNYYYTPYFDGYNDIERMFVMDTAMVTKVLDSTSGWDTGTTNGGSNPSGNVVQGGFYTPFVDATNNYPTAQTVDVLKADGTVGEATIAVTDNIIAQQNALLANGCTGQQLAQQLIEYINTAYADFFTKGFFENPSDLYISNAAAYNADDMIALMRVIKANPGLITGDAAAEIETLFPRACSNNRIENMFDFAQIWGVQGVDGESANFFVAGDGKIHALETTKASYDALTYLSQIYDEGLILGDFYTNAAQKADGSDFLNKYWKKTVDGSGYGFMVYDYSASTTAANDQKDGIGTNPASRAGTFKNTSVQGLTAVLPPLTYWATESNWDHSQNINDFTGKTLTRYYESNRALKTNTWAMPKSADNKEGAAIMMDFLFSDLGVLMQDYGPTNYWDSESADLVDVYFDAKGKEITKAEADAAIAQASAAAASGEEYVDPNITTAKVSKTFVPGENNALLSKNIKASLANSGKDFWTYCRNWLGSTHGIGHVRSKGINIQATNYYAQWGCKNVAAAIAAEVVDLAMVDKYANAELRWDSSVPTGFTKTYSDTNKDYTAITGFWGTAKFGQNNGWVGVVCAAWDADKTSIVVKDGDKNDTTYQAVLDQFDQFNKKALYTYANSVEAKYVPAYATSQA